MIKVSQFRLIEKVAEEYSWMEKQRGLSRATRASDTGFKRILADPKLLESRKKEMKKGRREGLRIGAPIGTAAGLVSGTLLRKSFGKTKPGKVIAGGAAIGAAIGALFGIDIGESSGLQKADRKFLGRKGITLKGFSADYTPAAAKKYLRPKWERTQA